jgi:transposase InsO family protein
VKRVAQVLGVSRSQLTERLKGAAKIRSHYAKTDDAELMAPLRALVDERPTYGYRRITALMNRERLKNSLPRLNHKRIYRLMSQNGMLLQRYTAKPPGRVHDGQIISIRPNLRWTSDGFEIACWSGQVVRVAFALDTCDREVMAWCASTGGVSGEMIRDLSARASSGVSVQVARRRQSNGSRITAVAIERMKPSTSRWAWGSFRASRRCAAGSRTAWPNRSSKPSSEITCMFTIVLMLKPSCLSYRRGSRTTTRATRIKPCE